MSEIITKKKAPTSLVIILMIAILLLIIFGLLLPNLYRLVPIQDNYFGTPNIQAKTLIKTQLNNPGVLSYTEKTTFDNRKYKSISSAEISNLNSYPDTIPISSNQIMFLTNNLSEFTISSETPGNQLTYNLTKKGTYKIGIFCDYKESLDNSIKEYPKIPSTASSSLFSDDLSGQKVCVIFPKKVE